MGLIRLTIFFSLLLLFSCTPKKSLEPNTTCAQMGEMRNVRMHDWGKIFFTETQFCESSPATLAEVQTVLRRAYDASTPVRIRGRGHSMDGKSLPRSGELLLFTDNVRHYQWKKSTVIQAGAGMSVYALQSWLHERGFTLPIFTDVMGPSVGGFVSASGISMHSRTHGGLWNNVSYVQLVDARGEVHTIRKSDKDFPWLFGSMGQLGFIYEVGLKVLPLKKARFTPSEGKIEESRFSGPKQKDAQEEYTTSRLLWLTVIAPIAEKQNVMAELREIKAKHSDTLNFIPEYVWPVKRGDFTPPLFYPENRDLISIGIWGEGNPKKENLNLAILDLSDAVWRLLAQRPFYRRYIQTEPIRFDVDWHAYFGENIFQQFAALHTKYNPKGNMNNNCIFENAHCAKINIAK